MFLIICCHKQCGDEHSCTFIKHPQARQGYDSSVPIKPDGDLAGREKWCPCLTNLAEMVNVLGLVVLGAEFGGGAWFIRTNSQGGTYPSLGTVLWHRLDGPLLRTTEGPTETLNTIPKAAGGPHMVHLAPDYDLFPAMAVRPSQCWWILFGTRHHCGAGGPAVPGLALGRVWVRKVAINLTTHTHQCTLRAFYLKSGKLWPGPSFRGQRPEKACWESTFPAWSWPRLTTQKNMPITHKIRLWVSTVSPEFV